MYPSLEGKTVVITGAGTGLEKRWHFASVLKKPM